MATPKPQQRTRDRDSPNTPLSPTVYSRKTEKDQMVNLNNRMAVYVEKVRSLESENSRLQILVSNSEQTSTREVSNMKGMYEQEISEARRLLDELSKEKAEIQIEMTTYKDRSETEKIRANGLAHDYSVLESKYKEVMLRLSAQESLCASAIAEKNSLSEELELTRAKLNDAQGEAEENKKLLDGETLQRVDFENKLQSMREELRFNQRLYQEEITEVRKRQTVSVTEIDQKVKGEYESKLESAIIDLREQQGYDLDQMKDELEGQFTVKIETLTHRLDASCKAHSKAQELLKAAELKIDRYQINIRSIQTTAAEDLSLQEELFKILTGKNNNLTNRVQDLEGQVESEREMRMTAVVSVEKQRDEAREMLKNMEKEYHDLVDLKIKLDQEISVYRKLLEEEEQRLNLSPSPAVSGSGSKRGRARRKRKRTAQVEVDAKLRKQQQETTTTTTYTSETITTEQQKSEGNGNPEGNNSCIVM